MEEFELVVSGKNQFEKQDLILITPFFGILRLSRFRGMGKIAFLRSLPMKFIF